MEITPYENNPKKHDDGQLKALAEIVAKVGWRQPIVVNLKGVIVVGHGRWFAWLKFGKELGLKEPWVVDTKGNTIMGQPETKPMTEEEEVGYDLLSVWDVVEDANTATGKYFLPLPINPGDKSRNRVRYSRTHPDELEKVVRTYMREGDYFLEACVGWASFSSVAKFYGYSGVGIDIWETSLAYCKKQLDAMPGTGEVEVKEMDAMNMKFEDNTFDIVYCNPPFFNLEGYKQSANDMSNTSEYGTWLDSIKKMTTECFRVLKPDGLAIFTMADFRQGGVLVDAHSDWTRLCKEVGFSLWDHAIQKIKSTRKRNYKARYCVKGAEHILVFKKVIDKSSIEPDEFEESEEEYEEEN